MFLVDYPYISDFLRRTLRDHALPVVDTPAARQLNLLEGTRFIGEKAAVEAAAAPDAPPVYTTSENALGWLSARPAFDELCRKIALFKDKFRFRELIRPLYPEFFFRLIPASELKSTRIDDFPLPFIIKPAIGFFSMGVHRVERREEWKQTVDAILSEMRRIEGRYPRAVLDAGAFIAEACVEGDEYAVDAYFDDRGRPVVMSILHHVFSSQADVSDRVYTSSKKIIEENIGSFTALLEDVGKLAGIRNFPVHAELRRTADGGIVPIEINPMRFGGWCSTPDLTAMAYGFNPYLYYYRRRRPDWAELLRDRDGRLFSIVVLDNSTGVPPEEIVAFDYAKLLARFEKPLELRKIDYRKYNVFAFLFTETAEAHFNELEAILGSDLREFVTV